MACTLSAVTIDVSSQSFQTLQSGNTLSFLFSDSSYSRLAGQLGISPYPAQIDFLFLSTSPISSGDFTANLESLDGSASIAIPGAFEWQTSYVSFWQYAGPVSSVSGLLSLSPADSQAIFENNYAQLVLTYTGEPVTVGLGGYALPNAMFVSESGGPISGIGAMVYSATYDPPSPNVASVLPEPATLWQLCGGAGFFFLAAGLKRLGRRRFNLPTSYAAR